MLRKCFAIRDQKAGAYQDPLFFRSHGEAERAFELAVRNPESTWHKHPNDYDLFHVGDFDDVSGKFEPLDTPQHVVKAAHLLTPTP